MEKVIQQEILLICGTKFSSRQCWQKINERSRPASEIEQLEDACWNGLLNEMLPEIFVSQKDLFLWQIRETKCGLEIELGELPAGVDYFYSIDPYLFLGSSHLN